MCIYEFQINKIPNPISDPWNRGLPHLFTYGQWVVCQESSLQLVVDISDDESPLVRDPDWLRRELTLVMDQISTLTSPFDIGNLHSFDFRNHIRAYHKSLKHYMHIYEGIIQTQFIYRSESYMELGNP